MSNTILGTGLTGMVGTGMVAILEKTYTFENLSLSNGFDIRDVPQVYSKIGNSDAGVVLHLAAKSDVDACEADKHDDKKLRLNTVSDTESFDPSSIDWSSWKNSESATAINIHGVNNVANACKKYGKKLVFFSTDFVFDGSSSKPYKEDDLAKPVNFYGLTKKIGEMIVNHVVQDALVLRIAFPYGSNHPKKKDFVAGIASKLKNKQQVEAPADSLITPTLIEDIAHAVDILVSKGARGIYHVVGKNSLSPYDAALAIADAFGYDKNLVKKTTHREFYKNKAPRPQYVALSSEKAAGEGVTLRKFDEGLATIDIGW